MKLQDFLKCKKVRCVKAYDDCLKIGKEYDVIDISVEIKVKDDEGNFLYWEFDHFEPVLDSAENPLQGAELTPEFEAVSPKFKVGDKVYYRAYADICVVSDVSDLGEVQIKGWREDYYNSRYFCHATQENYEMLCNLYPHIEFEQPPKPLSGDDIVRAMLKKGIKNVLCLWGNGDKIIIDRLDYKGSLMSTNCNIVGGLTPIDWYTGEPLTEAVLDE
nr:hypothetical protein [Moraxella sp. CTOTU47616]